MTTEIPLYARINGAKAFKAPKDATGDVMLTGITVAVQRRTSEYGDYPCVIVDAGDPHLWAFHAFHTVAKDQLKEVKPSPGESITIVIHPKAAANKRKDTNGEPVMYTPYTIFNPDAQVEIGSSWTWDDAETEPGF